MTKPAPGAEVLRTERLILRRFRLEDTPAYFEMFNQPRVEATLVPGPGSLEEAARHVAMVEGHWDLVGMSFMAVIEKSTGLLVGRVGPWFPYGWPAPEVGWTIHPRRHRRGYAAEAARASAQWLLTQRSELDKVI
ncbi:MAG: GNAT family N-acetyltransferase, partial [Pseudomonadota bacterium]